MCVSIDVMRIFNEMRCDLSIAFKVDLGFARTVGRNGRNGEYPRPMSKIRERNKKTTVLVENNLKRFNSKVAGTNGANDALRAYRVNVLGLVAVHVCSG